MKIRNQQKQQQQQQQAPITINRRNIREVISFTYLLNYLGSIVSTTGGTGTDDDAKVGIGKTERQVFLHHSEISVEIYCTAPTIKREQHQDFQQLFSQVSQCFHVMVERIGVLRKAFPTNYRHSSTAATYAHSILKIR
ncbi:unnamed protein product [Heterobilharzia americana]|nr:unnamed protein product [Heterobilharzia americana]